jgi:hypothetical protein
MTNMSLHQPMAVCRDNYGYGKFQAVNKTHLHWTWSMTGVGTSTTFHVSTFKNC